MEKKKYPIGPDNYQLYEEVGQGVSASVYRALCKPFNEIVAIKILDFERDNSDLSNISREAQTMFLVDHPNVLKSHCSFVNEHNLWVVMPYMAGGSCLHILKAAYPDGFEEVVIATILRDVLKGLDYLHHHGHIHRDVKAGNILIDGRGAIKLGDFGVSACLFDSGDRQRMRNTFVGTPCWMAPEVMEQLHGYDFKADIWSFGITALELAHGHAPFSKYPPMKVLLMTLQNAPPGLDYERDKKFSKSFKQMIASCLVKDPIKRPSAKKLLKHSFFKQARSNDYITRTLLEGLPALGDRMMALKRKEEDMLAQKKMPDGQKEELSQNEYKRGISGWNFNLDDMKAQASLIQDDDSASDSTSFSGIDGQEKQSENQVADMKRSGQLSHLDTSMATGRVRFDKSDDDSSIASPCYERHALLTSPRPCDHNETNMGEKASSECSGKSTDGGAGAPSNQKMGGPSGSIISVESTTSSANRESDKLQNQPQNSSYCNGAAASSPGDDALAEIASKGSKSSANSDELDEKGKPPVVQRKGRFKVTSESVDLDKVATTPVLQKSQSMQVLSQHPAISLSATSDATQSTLSGYSLFPMLHSVLQTNILQREGILSMMKQVSVGESTANRAVDGIGTAGNMAALERTLLETAHDREKELLNEITELQWRLVCAQEELQKYKSETAQG